MKKIKSFLKVLKSNDGWTFMETLIVIAIVMVLTASAGFMVSGCLDRAKYASARGQIEAFCVALEGYYIDCGNYPTTEQGLEALRKKPEIQILMQKSLDNQGFFAYTN